MGDLLATDKDGLIDAEEESLPRCSEVEPYPSTSYGILSVEESKDVHVGAKYVADKIVIVLPKSAYRNETQVKKSVLPILQSLNYPKSSEVFSTPTRPHQCICLSLVFLVLNVAILSGVYVTTRSSGATTNELPTIVNKPKVDLMSGSYSVPTSVTSGTKLNNQTPEHLSSNTTDHLLYTFSRSGAITSTNEIPSVNINDNAVSVSERYTDSTKHYKPPCENLDPQDFLAVKYEKAINVKKWSDKMCLVRSWEWGSRSCPYYLCDNFSGAVSHVYFHYIDGCGSFQTCSGLVRKYERDYYETDVTATNFLYNFVIGGDNRIYEALGWGYQMKERSSKWIHIGIQLWDGQPTNTSDVSVKQMYNIILLITVGRWCEKLKFNFDVTFVCEPACYPYSELYHESMVVMQYMKSDEYYLDDEDHFTIDSKRLGLEFVSCTGMVFSSFRVCDNYPCKTVKTD